MSLLIQHASRFSSFINIRFTKIITIYLKQNSRFFSSLQQHNILQFIINEENIQQVVQYAIKKNQQKQKKYLQLKKIRRYIFIDEQIIDIKNLSISQKSKLQLTLLTIPIDSNTKLYTLNNTYNQYYNKYPFTCLLNSQYNKLKQLYASPQQLDKYLLYPFCRFPTQIIQQKLYIGNVFSSNSEKQLNDLKIQCLVDFIYYQPDTEQGMQTIIPKFKYNQQRYYFIQLPFNQNVSVTINFDIINQNIDEQVNRGTTLLYCKDGESISAAFAISYLMYKANLDISMSTLKVCQALGRTNITKWIYSQLLVYKPKKKAIENMSTK